MKMTIGALVILAAGLSTVLLATVGSAPGLLVDFLPYLLV